MKKNISLFFTIIIIVIACNSRKIEVGYYDDGKIKFKAELINGKRNGILTEYFENGGVESKSVWKDDEMNGKALSYYPTGELKEKSFWKSGKQEGPSLDYHKNGSLWCRAFYKDNHLIGEITFYDEKGRIVERRIHDEDGKGAYWARFDSTGFKYIENVLPIYTDEKDTIKVGETFRTKARFGLKLNGTIRLLTGKFSENNILLDTTAVFEPDENGIFHIELKPEKLGKNEVKIIVSHIHEKKDTLSANDVINPMIFYVEN